MSARLGVVHRWAHRKLRIGLSIINYPFFSGFQQHTCLIVFVLFHHGECAGNIVFSLLQRHQFLRFGNGNACQFQRIKRALFITRFDMLVGLIDSIIFLFRKLIIF